MTTSDSGFSTNTGMADTDIAKLRQLISEVVGDPKLAGMLTSAFESAFGKTFSSNVNMFGGATMPYGSSSMFGPQDAGMNMLRWSQDQSISATMAESTRIVDEMKRDQRENYLMAFGGADSPEQAKAMSERFTFTGMMSNFMFNQLQTGSLQRGVEEGSRYMGAGALGFDKATLDTQRNASSMGAAVTGDFISNPENYSGLKGADVGRLYAEMGRTGQLAKIQDQNEGMFGPGNAQGAVIKATQEASRSIQAFRQIFRGSVTDVLDQVNALMGMDVMATFDDQGRSLMQVLESGTKPQRGGER